MTTCTQCGENQFNKLIYLDCLDELLDSISKSSTCINYDDLFTYKIEDFNSILPPSTTTTVLAENNTWSLEGFLCGSDFDLNQEKVKDVKNTMRKYHWLRDQDEAFNLCYGATEETFSILYKLNRWKRLLRNDPCAILLIHGPSGSGKGNYWNVYRSLIDESLTGNKDAFSCASLNESTIASELFGHTKGAFTGATEKKEGRLPYCKNGALNIDEFQYLSYTNQCFILRLVEHGEIQRVGQDNSEKINIQLVFSSSKDPEIMVEKNELIEELYGRIDKFKINIQPLYERINDIAPIIQSGFKEKSFDHLVGMKRKIKIFGIQRRFGVAKTLVQMDKNDPTKQLKRQFPHTFSAWVNNVRSLFNYLEKFQMAIPDKDDIRFNQIDPLHQEFEQLDQILYPKTKEGRKRYNDDLKLFKILNDSKDSSICNDGYDEEPKNKRFQGFFNTKKLQIEFLQEAIIQNGGIQQVPKILNPKFGDGVEILFDEDLLPMFLQGHNLKRYRLKKRFYLSHPCQSKIYKQIFGFTLGKITFEHWASVCKKYEVTMQLEDHHFRKAS